VTESLGRAELELSTKQSGLDAGLQKAETNAKGWLGRVQGSFDKLSKSSSFGAIAQGVGLGVGLAGWQAVGAAVGNTIQYFGDAIGAASDLAETVSKVNVVFGDQADKILDLGKTSATALGMSENAALAAAGTYGNLFRAMGITEESSADMSVGLVKLAADLASFNNMDPTMVLDKLRAGLSGETEPLRSLGVNLNQATIEAKALELGLWSGSGAITAAAKAQASYALILEQTTLAQGDFARTSDGLANSQRVLEAELADLSAAIGKELLPIWLDLVRGVRDFLPVLKELIPIFVTTTKIALWPFTTALSAIIETVKAVNRTITDMALNFGDMGDRVHATADKLGVDFQDVKDKVRDAMVNSGMSFDEALAHAEKALDGIPERVKTTGSRAAAALAGSASEVGAAAETGITDPIVDAATKAREDAAAEALKMPGEIAQAIIDGRDEVLAAATGLSTAATDPLLQKAKITEIRAQMREVAEVTAEELKAATPATIAADKLKYAQLEIELAGYLLRADPKSKEAAQLLAKYANSEEPATRAAYEALMGAVEARATVMATNVEAEAEAAGISVPEALKRHQEAARNAAAMLAKGTKDALHFDASAGGASSAMTFVNALAATLESLRARNRISISLEKLRAVTLGGSLPTAGPFAHPETGAISIGEAWWGGLSGFIDRAASALSPSRFTAPLQRASAGMGATPGMATMVPGAGLTQQWILNVDGVPKSVGSKRQAIEELEKLGSIWG
jgi:hypothetical protein